MNAMPVTITLDPARQDLDAIHRILACTYWSPGIRRDIVAEALRNSITAVAIEDTTSRGISSSASRLARMIELPSRENRGWLSRTASTNRAEVWVMNRLTPEIAGIALPTTVRSEAPRWPFGGVCCHASAGVRALSSATAMVAGFVILRQLVTYEIKPRTVSWDRPRRTQYDGVRGADHSLRAGGAAGDARP